MRILLTGGGTGGHLYPGLSILAALEKKVECETLFVGTKHGIENRVIPQYKIPFKKIWMSGLHRGRFWGNILFPLKMMVSLLHSMAILLQFQPDVVVGTGGYVSWPVMTAGVLLRKRTIIQEQNRKPGLVTRLLAPWVDSVHLSFESSKTNFKKQKNLHLSGNPTRDDLEFNNPDKAYPFFNLDPEKITLFIFGGSQGARAINEIVLASLDDLLQRDNLQLLWAAGPIWIDSIVQKTRGYHNRVCVLPYIEYMGMAYAISDLIICRSGASTIAEITRLGLSALFIPFPGAAGGHQLENARDLVEHDAADMILEKDLEKTKFTEKVFNLVDNRDRLLSMAKRAKSFGQSDAANKIAEDILKNRYKYIYH